jgi:hypothetical protein
MTDKQQFIAELPRSFWPMDARPSSAVVDTEINQAAGKACEHRELQVGGSYLLARFGAHAD